MNIRRVLLDVDKAMQRPEIIEVAETLGMDITVEGDNIDIGALFRAIESTGAVVTQHRRTGGGRTARGADSAEAVSRSPWRQPTGLLLPVSVLPNLLEQGALAATGLGGATRWRAP